MRTRLLAALALLLAVVPAYPLGLADPSAPWVTVGAPAAIPTIDGAIGAEEWAGATPLAGFGGVGTRELSPLQPSARLTRDATRLFVAVHVLLPGGREPAALARERDGAVWNDDSVEIFLDPRHSQEDYFQLAGNPLGTRLDAHRRDAAWNADWEYAARKSAGGWDAEFAIPFAALGVPPPADDTIWGLNVCVNLRGGGNLSWAPVTNGYHQPGRLGHLRFLPGFAAGVESLAGILSGGGDVKGIARGAGVTLRSELSRGGAKLDAKSTPAGSGEFALPVAIPREGRFPAGGRYALTVVVERAGDSRPLTRLVAERVVHPPLELKARAFVQEGVLEAEAAIESAGMERAGLACRFTVGPAGGAPAITREVPVADGRSARASFPKAEVPEGKIEVAATLLEKGAEIKTARKVLDRPLAPPWIGDRTGVTDRVPAPWTPITVSGKEARSGARSAIALRPWGREYRFEGGLFPSAVVARGASVLAGPIAMRLARGGRALPWQSAWARVAKSAPGAVDLSGEASGPGVRLMGTARLEFDGMLRVDISLIPGAAAAPDAVVLEIPLKAEHARYLYHFPGQWGSVGNSGALPAEGWKHAFKPFVWLGDEDRGFSWFCESEENWSPADKDRAITIEREGDRVVLRLHLVEGQPLARPLRYTFGFQATPVKQPDKDVWDYRIHHGGSYSLHTAPYSRSGRITYPAAGNVRGDKGTFEAWIQPLFNSDPALPEAEKRKQTNRSIFTVKLPGDTNCGIYWNEVHQGPVVWVRENGEVRFYAGASIACKKGEWHHLAFTWGDAIRAYFDGKCVFGSAYAGLTAQPLERGEIILGEREGQFALDDVRILDEARVPTVPTGPLAADAHTLFLERFDWPAVSGSTQPEKGSPGKVSGAAALVAGRFGQAVQLCGESAGSYSLLDRLGDMGVRTVCFHEHWTPWQSHPYTTPENEPALAALTTAIHAKKMQFLLYMSRQIADIAPEYELYGEDVLTLPRVFSYTRAPQQTDWGICWRSHWKEFCLKGLAETMDRFGNDGWYLDGPEWPCPCTNRRHGCGYVKADGSIGPTYDIFATRDFMRRLYVFTRERKPEGQLNIHNSTVMVIPTLGWGTSTWNGEQLGSIDRGPEFLKLMPLDAFRTEMMGHQFGTPSEFLCYERPWTTHEALSFTLLHDVLIRPNGYDDRLEEISGLWRAMDAFGRKGAKWLPYWSNGNAARPEGEAVKVSLYTRGKEGALLVVSNLSTEPREVTVTLDLARLGLPAGARAANALTHEPVTLEKGRLSVPLAGFDYALVDVK